MFNKRCIVTGGAGFIGSALVRHLVRHTEATVLVVDKLTYAGNLESVKEVADSPRYSFMQADICDAAAMDRAFAEFRPDTIFHLAAESHVDRSIDGPGEFIRTNVTGTATLLQSALAYWRTTNHEPRTTNHEPRFPSTSSRANTTESCAPRTPTTSRKSFRRRLCISCPARSTHCPFSFRSR